MPMLSTAIVAICVSAQGGYNQACNAALDAGTRQVGLRQNADLLESKVNDVANREAEKKIGKDGMAVLGSGFFLARVARDRSVSFRLPNLGLCDSVSNDITTESYRLNLKWNF